MLLAFDVDGNKLLMYVLVVLEVLGNQCAFILACLFSNFNHCLVVGIFVVGLMYFDSWVEECFMSVYMIFFTVGLMNYDSVLLLVVVCGLMCVYLNFWQLG
jgi:hypothetical protein